MARESGDEAQENGEKRRSGITARSVLHAVKRRPLTLVGVALLAAAVGAGVWFFLPLPKSTAAMVFYVAPSRPSLLDGNTGGGDAHSYRQSQTTLIKRRLTLNNILKQPNVQQLEVVRKQPEPLAWLEHTLKAETKFNNDFITVSLEGDNAEELQVILDALSKAYLADVDERDNGARRERLRKLEETNRTYRAEVERFHKRIDTIALALGSKDGATLAVVDSLMKDELRTAIRELATARDNLQLAELASTSGVEDKGGAGTDRLLPWGAGAAQPNGAVVTPLEIENEMRLDPVLKQLEAEVAAARQVLATTQALFRDGERRPSVVQAEEKVKAAEQKRDAYRAERRPAIEAVLRKRSEETAQSKAAAAKVAAETLKSRVELAKAKVGDIQKGIAKSNDYRIELENIKSLIAQTEKLSETLGGTIERLKVELGAPPRVTLADEPFAVKGLEGNRRLKFTLMAALGVLVAGFAAVVGWEHRARRLTHADEVTRDLGLRLLGSVPGFGGEADKAREANPILIEAIDATRTMLVHGTEQPDLRVLAVTSAVSGEGKTSLSGHLAISLARAGFRTLLVDGDLRAPTAQRLFDLPLGPGLCELLEGRASIAEAVRPLGLPGLSVLTAGHWSAATHQALVGDRWRVAKEQLKAEFDYVVVDTSPLLLVSDSLLLAREADGVVVSILLGVSQVALTDEAVRRLRNVRANFTGVIANGVAHAAHQYVHGYSAGRSAALGASSTAPER
jgi:capsular exopolysaccharide synthesis family protein